MSTLRSDSSRRSRLEIEDEEERQVIENLENRTIHYEYENVYREIRRIKVACIIWTCIALFLIIILAVITFFITSECSYHIFCEGFDGFLIDSVSKKPVYWIIVLSLVVILVITVLLWIRLCHANRKWKEASIRVKQEYEMNQLVLMNIHQQKIDGIRHKRPFKYSDHPHLINHQVSKTPVVIEEDSPTVGNNNPIGVPTHTV